MNALASASAAWPEFLRLVAQAKTPTMHAPQWHARIGRELSTALLKSGVLVPRAAAEWYACGGPWGDGCPRRVVANRGCAEHPFVAVCGKDDGSCIEMLLRAEDREVWTLSLDALVRQLRRALTICGAADVAAAGFPDTRRIGERAGRAVYLALAPATPGFAAWLAGRVDALVLVPDLGGVPIDVRERFGTGQRVELVALTKVLGVENGVIVGALDETPPALNEHRAPAHATTEPTMCVVVDHNGKRSLTAREYAALVARANECDLFVDMTVTVEGGGHPAHRRDGDGAVAREVLTRHEAALLVELVTTRKALRAGDFASVTANDIGKLIERARRKVDVRLGRYEWRAIHTLAGDIREAKRWRFGPPEGLRFAVVGASGP